MYADPDELQRTVEIFMIQYDKREAEAKRKSKEVEVDDDGFTLVKPSVKQIQLEEVSPTNSKKKKRAELDDFYRFQLKERKTAEWNDVQKQKEMDRRKIEEMKSNKKFQL